MSLLTPELLLLALPATWALLRTTRPRSVRFLLRALGAAALLLALAGPYGGGRSTGRDLVLVVDRSRSMPGESGASVAELARLLGDSASSGDRLAVLSFGADVVLELPLGRSFELPGSGAQVDRDGSHLADALDHALALIPEHRPGSILLVSDGEFHGADPEDAVRRASLRDVRVDVRGADGGAGSDVAVERIDLPESVAVGEPFQFSGWVRSDRAADARWQLLRGDTVISSGSVALRRGSNRLLFRDLAAAPGLAGYRLVVETDGDGAPENNRGLGVTRVDGRRPLLLVNPAGAAGRLTVALREAGMEVDVRSPGTLPNRAPGWLEGYAGVVLEDVSATSLESVLPGLAAQVRDLGAGLLMTGGPAAFGVGGYHRSALDPLLPVTLEVRIEHRKMALAMAIVLDRSGSMAVAAEGGRTKMDLANAGAIEAVSVLGPLDEVAIVAVDSDAHVVVPLRPVDDLLAISRRISGIESMGGGIYTYTGLRAAAEELEGAQAGTRHVILFADANDAEEPEGCAELLAQLRDERRTTVSVVALGSTSDSDAAFLREVAARGGGQSYFTRSAAELPRLFAQDTLLAARSSFVEELTASVSTSALLAISGSAQAGPWAAVPGYNLTYLRPGAAAGVLTTDEYGAPLVATMQAGLGRSAAFCGQVDGRFGVAHGDWPLVASALVTLARWITAQEPPEGWFASVRRDGTQALVSIELDRQARAESGAEPLFVQVVRPDGSRQSVPLEPAAGDRYHARISLGGEGVYRLAAATASGDMLPLAPQAVPYSPEFEPRTVPDEGARTLGRLARIGRGRLNPTVPEILAGSREGRASQSLTSWFVGAALLLILAEILWRRVLEGRWAPRRAAESLQRNDGQARARAPTHGVTQPTTPASTAAPVVSVPTPAPAVPTDDEPDLHDMLAQVKRRHRGR